MTISYIITACNEHKELDNLLTKLVEFVQDPNEIIVVLDDGNTTEKVFDVIEKFKDNISCYSHKLENNFAQHKNFANTMANCDWIFQLDSDEMPHETLLMSLHMILNTNPGAEAIWVPRINIVKGLTGEHIEKWGWNLNEKGWINFPDYQMRLYINNPKIKWEKPVHEVITGFTTYAALPAEEEYCLYHHKDIKKQEKQNEMYDKL